MSVLGAAGEFVGDAVKFAAEVAQPFGEGVEGQRVEARCLGLGGCASGGETGQTQCSLLVEAQRSGNGDDARRLRGSWLVGPVVDRGAADVAALAEPRFGAAHLGEGGFDQVEERLGGGVVAHIFMCTEMESVLWPFSLPRSDKSWLVSARDGKSKKGVSHVYLSRTQACGRLNISPPTLLKRIRAGEIEAIKLGDARNSPVKVPLASIEAYEKKSRMIPEGAAA